MGIGPSALELHTISQTFKRKHLWQNTIFIAALCIAMTAVPQSLQALATLGTNSRRLAGSQARQAECGTSDFTFSELRAQPAGYGFTRISGRISNNCAEAKSAQIKITTYNRAGDILSDDDIWPGNNNIPAHSELPFEWIDTNAVFARFTVTIISVKSWPETLVRRFPFVDGEPANTLTPSNERFVMLRPGRKGSRVLPPLVERRTLAYRGPGLLASSRLSKGLYAKTYSYC